MERRSSYVAFRSLAINLTYTLLLFYYSLRRFTTAFLIGSSSIPWELLQIVLIKQHYRRSLLGTLSFKPQTSNLTMRCFFIVLTTLSATTSFQFLASVKLIAAKKYLPNRMSLKESSSSSSSESTNNACNNLSPMIRESFVSTRIVTDERDLDQSSSIIVTAALNEKDALVSIDTNRSGAAVISDDFVRVAAKLAAADTKGEDTNENFYALIDELLLASDIDTPPIPKNSPMPKKEGAGKRQPLDALVGCLGPVIEKASKGCFETIDGIVNAKESLQISNAVASVIVESTSSLDEKLAGNAPVKQVPSSGQPFYFATISDSHSAPLMTRRHRSTTNELKATLSRVEGDDPSSLAPAKRKHVDVVKFVARPTRSRPIVQSSCTRAVNTRSSKTQLKAAATNSDDDHNTSGKVASTEHVDIAIVGSGLAGLSAGAILNACYGKKVGIYESHYLAGGCAHAFDRKASNGVTFTFDSGPTILLGCSSPPLNALQQVLNVVGQEVKWIPYDGWGMVENPGKPNELRWRVELGPDRFEQGPLQEFGGESAYKEFKALQEATKGLLAGASIPAMAMRPGPSALFPLVRYFSTLVKLISQGKTTTGTFAPFLDGPLFVVTDEWLRSWLDALAFSLSGLPASRTAAAAMAFVLSDMHRPGAMLDYPEGGMGVVVKALVRGVESGSNGSKLYVQSHVESIDCSDDAQRITGLTLKNGKRIIAREGVICNAPVWTLASLIKDKRVLKRLNNGSPPLNSKAPSTWTTTSKGATLQSQREVPLDKIEKSLLDACNTAEQTGSFLHLHVALHTKVLNISALEAHYTVMDRGLADDPCGQANMIAVSNPCAIDSSLAPAGYMVLHAYSAGNEPYELWENLNRTDYEAMKTARAQVLWRAVTSIIPDARERSVLSLIGSPLTHERFLRRPQGTYGSATEDYLRDGSTAFPSLVIANDGVFPGVGVPSSVIAGASAAHAFVPVLQQWQMLHALGY